MEKEFPKKYYEKLELNEFKLNSLLEITKAINNNLSIDNILKIFEYILREQLGISKLILYAFDSKEWNCILHFGSRGLNKKINVLKDLTHIKDITVIESSSIDTINSFDIVIPIFHKKTALAFLLIGDLEDELVSISPGIKHMPFIQTLASIIVVAIENKRFSSKMSKISCLINVDLSNELLDSIFINKKLSSIVKTPNNKKWFQFDIDYAPKTIKIVAISNYDSLLTLNEPIFYSFNDWIPNDIEFLEKKLLEIKKDSNSQTPFIKCLNLKFKDEILERENDLIVLESPLNNLAKLFFNDSNSESYSTSFSSTLDTSKLKVVFPNFNFNDKQGFIKDHFLIIATEDGKKELEINISQRNDSKFNNSIFVKEENEEFNQSHSQFSYLSQSEIIKNFNSPRARLDSIIFNLIKSIGGISWTVNNYDQRELHGINIKKFYPKKVDKKILWKTTIPKLIWGPYALNNHRTNTKDIIVQDLDNIIYLISAGGKIKWSIKL